MKRINLVLLALLVFTSACTRPASTQEVLPTSTSEIRLCRAGDLQASSSSNDTGGTTVLGVTLLNTSMNKCTLVGPPQVTLIADGQPLEVQVTQAQADQTPPASPGLDVSSGESAILILVWRNYCGAAPAGSLTIRLGLTTNEALEAGTEGTPTPRCDARDEPSTLDINPYSFPP